jgi:flagellar motor switch protein FliG
MLESISKTEKSDILLALALAFEKKLNENETEKAAQTASQLTEKFAAVFSAEDSKHLKTRAEFFDRLAPDKRKLWQKIRLDKIRRRGLSDRLDGNVHPAQIAEILNREPKTIQLLVLKNLPAKVSRKIASNLKTKPAENEFLSEQPGLNSPVSEEIINLIRHHFVANFVALEDVFEPTETDKIPIQKLNDFIRQLGIRETAIACRGINSKETLAAFLNRFDEESAKEIAENITELENVKPVWVERADRLLRKTLENQFQPESLLRSLGLKILAVVFVRRDWAARKYTAQKMMPFESENWSELLAESEQEYKSAPDGERRIFDRRRQIVERIAAKFV